MVGINPFDVKFSEDHTEVIDRYSEIGVKHFWVNVFTLITSNKETLQIVRKAY